MKLSSFILILAISSIAFARPIFLAQNEFVSPTDVKNYILAFMDGFGFSKYAQTSQECQADGGVFYNFAAAGAENFFNHKYLDAALSVADALGEVSPMSRDCYDTSDELLTTFSKYVNQFSGIGDFISKVSLNAMSNVKPIKQKGTIILTIYLTTKDYVKIANLTGEIASLVLAFQDQPSLSGALKYTEADPLAADPINHILWTTFEGLYKFGINSRLVSQPTLQKCQEGLLNMAVLDEQAFALYKTGDVKNAWFTFADSLTFSHQIVDGCYHTSKEVAATAKKVKEQTIDGGKLFSNIFKNLFFVGSDSFASWSEIYYGDYINLLGALGSITYRVFVFGTN